METTVVTYRARIGRAALIAAAVLGAWIAVLALAPAGRAADYLYFAADPLLSNKLFRADQAAGGSSSELGPATTMPFTLVVTGTHLYTMGTSSIVRYDLNGQNPQTLPFTPCQGNSTGATGLVVQSLAVNSTHLFYVCRDNGTNTTEAIGRAGLDGSNPDPNYMVLDSDTGGLQRLVANETHLFFTQAPAGDRKIGKAVIGDISTKQMMSVITGLAAGTYNFQGLALTSSHVYWSLQSSSNPDQIGRTTVALGDQQNAFLTPGTTNQIGAIAASSSYLFWRSSGSPERIARASITGGTANLSFITLASGTNVLALGVPFAAAPVGPEATTTPTTPTPAPAPTPAPTVKTSGLKARTTVTQTGPNLTTGVDCTTTNSATLKACTVELVVQSSALKQGGKATGKTTVIGRATRTSSTGAATIAVQVRVTSKAAKRILAATGRLRVTVRITATSTADQVGTASRATTLVVAKKKAAKAAFRR